MASGRECSTQSALPSRKFAAPHATDVRAHRGVRDHTLLEAAQRFCGNQSTRNNRCQTRVRLARKSGSVIFAESGSEKPSRSSRQFLPIEELSREPEALVDPHDEQLLEVSLALDDHLVAPLLGRYGLHLDELAIDGPVGAGAVGPVAASPNLTSA